MGVIDSGIESQMRGVKCDLAADGRGSMMAASEGACLISEPRNSQQDVFGSVRQSLHTAETPSNQYDFLANSSGFEERSVTSLESTLRVSKERSIHANFNSDAFGTSVSSCLCRNQRVVRLY
jgi:hypothetical protein